MVAKLVIGLTLLAILIAAVGLGAFWYFRETARMRHEREMSREDKEHEERMELFDDGDDL